jgi:hypothetical protein
MKLLGAVLVLSLAVSSQQTSEPSPTPSAPETPQPAHELKKLEFLVGDWIYAETFSQTPWSPGGKGAGRGRANWAIGDHHLQTAYVSNNPLGRVEARGFMGFDREKKAYRFSWFDSRGLATHYAGDFDASGALVLTAEYTYDAKPVKERLTLAPSDTGGIALKGEALGPDGQWVLVFESVGTRSQN